MSELINVACCNTTLSVAIKCKIADAISCFGEKHLVNLFIGRLMSQHMATQRGVCEMSTNQIATFGFASQRQQTLK